jgi:putative ABC transport system permease protein
MWRNYLSAAIRNLYRNRAYAGINILGLAIGFAAAILIGLYVRDELSYDRMWPHADRTYRLSMDIKGGTTTQSLGNADNRFGPAMELDFPEVEFATRIGNASGYFKYKETSVWSRFGRADADFFQMFPPRAVAGDPDDALKKPDMLVVTRAFARKLFGREDIVGQTVELRLNEVRTMRVGAVIEDLPVNSHFRYDVVVSKVDEPRNSSDSAYIYVRFRPGADLGRVRAALPDFVRRHVPELIAGQPAWKLIDLKLTALPDIHFLPSSVTDMKAPSDRRTVDAFIVIGLLTLLVAGGNFVSMMTARAARRAVEVGVRKAVGASRGQIVTQFLGECALYAGLALILAVIAVELLLPMINGFLGRQIAFDYVGTPLLGVGILGCWLIVALAASAYPAAVLSMFRPVTVLKGALVLPGNAGRLRNAMIVAQFAVLVALIVCTITVHRQTRFAIEDQLRVAGDQLFVMRAPCALMAFQDVARRIAGVRAASCTSDAALGTDLGSAHFGLPSGKPINLNGGAVDTSFFTTFGIRPIAGRLFDEDHGEDNMLRQRGATANPTIIVNETGARALGYANPADAVGKSAVWSRSGVMADGQYGRSAPLPSQIVGVVPDFSVGTIRSLIQPSVYYVDPQTSFVLVLKLDGQKIPETLRAIEQAWKKVSDGRPMVEARFVSQMLNEQYADIRRQTSLFAAFSAVAIVVAALGLLSLAIFTAERRTREIGVRKCMGASRLDILRFIGWQFARPVLLANLIAWPAAWYFMNRWLQGFAYHIDLGVLAFVLASLLALGIALLTVTGHALMVSRARPAEALRYE